MRLRRGLAVTVGVALAASAMAGEARTSTGPAPEWNRERVLDLLLKLEREMERLENVQVGVRTPASLTHASCRGESVDYAIKTSVVMESLSGYVAGRALSCYVATNLGCMYGEWIAQPRSSPGAATRPFTRSKVTIVEQTPDKVIADVVEATPEAMHDGVLADWDDGLGKWIPYAGDISVYKESSRYTLTRGRDGVWRVSDRKPPFKWLCAPRD